MLVGNVTNDRVSGNGRGPDYMCSLLSFLRHVSKLLVLLDGCARASSVAPSVAYSLLKHYKELHSLELRGGGRGRYAANTLAAALNSLPSLTSLELDIYGTINSRELTASLHRLCSSQLDQLSVNTHQLYRLVQQQPPTAKRRLLSLAVILISPTRTLLRPLLWSCHSLVTSHRCCISRQRWHVPAATTSYTIVSAVLAGDLCWLWR